MSAPFICPAPASSVARKRSLLPADTELRGEQLNRFFKLSGDLLSIAGFDGYFKGLNPAWETTLGFRWKNCGDVPGSNLSIPTIGTPQRRRCKDS
jgi:hypothetical protein